MPFASEVHYPWRKGSDGVPPKPDAGLYAFPGPVQSVRSTDKTPGEAGGNTEQYSNQALFYAACLSTDNIGALVYASNGIASVTTADSDQPYPVVGMIISKSSPTTSVVQRYGPVMGVVSGLTANVRYFLHHDGGLFAPPFDGSDVVFVQQVGFALSADTFFIQPTGTVIKRDPGGAPESSLVVSIGNGAPSDSADYSSEDMYVDVDSGEAYFAPSATAGTSLVYMGHGPPSDTNGTAQDLYFDQDAQAFYLADDAADPTESRIILGHGAPTSGTAITSTSFYLDATSGEIYQNT